MGRTCLEEAERLLPDVASQLVRGGWGEREGKWGVPVLRKQSAFSQTSPLSWSVGEGGEGGGKRGVPVLRKPSVFSRASPLSWSVGDGGRGEGSGAYLLEEAEHLLADIAS